MSVPRSMPLMEYSSSCVFPTKLALSEYMMFFCLKAVLSATRVAKGERIFLVFFFLQPLFYQPEFALFLCDLIFFFRFWIFPLVVKKNKWSWKKLDRSKSSVYYLSAEQPTKCTGWLRFRAWIVLVYPQLGNNKTGRCARWSKLCWFGLIWLGWGWPCLAVRIP